VRRRRADVDADRPKAQPLGRDVSRMLIRIVRVTVMIRVMRTR